jgi:hypothetical protein
MKIIKCVIQLMLDFFNVLYYYVYKKYKAFTFKHLKGDWKMGTIICQTCDATIEHFEDEKVSVHYSNCDHCNNNHSAGE